MILLNRQVYSWGFLFYIVSRGVPFGRGSEVQGSQEITQIISTCLTPNGRFAYACLLRDDLQQLEIASWLSS